MTQYQILLTVLQGAARAVLPPQDRLEMLAAVQQWVDEQRALAFAELERFEQAAPRQQRPGAPQVQRVPRFGVVADAEFDE